MKDLIEFSNEELDIINNNQYISQKHGYINSSQDLIYVLTKEFKTFKLLNKNSSCKEIFRNEDKKFKKELINLYELKGIKFIIKLSQIDLSNKFIRTGISKDLVFNFLNQNIDSILFNSSTIGFIKTIMTQYNEKRTMKVISADSKYWEKEIKSCLDEYKTVSQEPLKWLKSQRTYNLSMTIC